MPPPASTAAAPRRPMPAFLLILIEISIVRGD
jgi:hypothetical protein